MANQNQKQIISSEYALDGIVTLVDAFHIDQQLGRSDESTEQIAFADVVVLNKTDLASSDGLDTIETRIREMNRMTKIVRAENAEVPVDTVLNLSAFNLDQALERRPTFLEPEYPFEWTGVYSVEPGEYRLRLDEGPDPSMSLVITQDQGTDDSDLRDNAEKCVRHYAEDGKSVSPDEIIPVGEHVELDLASSGSKSFNIMIEKPMQIGLFAQHTAEEFNIELMKTGSESIVPPVIERTWVAQHEHDDEVGSIAIEKDGDVDQEKLNKWLSKVLGEKGIDIFRMKGFLSISGDARRFVFQGVHMLFDAKPDRSWDDLPRKNQLVFIGRNLDEEEMRKGFEECLV